MSRPVKMNYELLSKVQVKFRKQISEALKKQKRFRNELAKEILEFSNNELSIKAVCELLDISDKTYHAWKNKGVEPEQTLQKWLLEAISEIHIKSGSRAGVRTIVKELQKIGKSVSEPTVSKYMNVLGIHGKLKQDRKHFKELKDQGYSNNDLIMGKWEAKGPDEKWFTDYAQFITDEGVLCVIAIIDTYRYDIVHWDSTMVNERAYENKSLGKFTANFLLEAYNKSTKSSGIIIHTDNGVEFVNEHFKAVVEKCGFKHSRTNSSKDIHEKRIHALENRPIEYFWKILRHHTTGSKRVTKGFAFKKEELLGSIRVFIDETYNQLYEQERLGSMTPYEINQIYMRRMADSKRANRAIAECYKSIIIQKSGYSEEEIEYTGLIYATIAREYLRKNGRHLFEDHPEFYPRVRYDDKDPLPEYITNLGDFYIHRVWKDDEYLKLSKKMKANKINISHSDLHKSIEALRQEAVQKVEIVLKQKAKQSKEKYKNISRNKKKV